MTPEKLPRLTVLVVEDQPDAAQSTATLLRLSGHAVRVATCGEDALRATTDETPDVVLLDLGLPDMSGWEVARQLRVRAAGKQPVIVAVTGYRREDDRWRSADSGFDLHLTKPVEPRSLVAMLDEFRVALAPAGM